MTFKTDLKGRSSIDLSVSSLVSGINMCGSSEMANVHLGHNFLNQAPNLREFHDSTNLRF